MASVFSGAGRRKQSEQLTRVLDADGKEVEYDVREDEEQSVKLNETIELLLAAGYFRARIKGLSPFDKVVGGMTWCIITCSVDVDVDLLFQENATIGQKIALTEKIVGVLPKMKCPHRIEPHQIQGLDFIHIYPVVQWLVKRAIETREELGDTIRSYAISQFDKFHSMPEDDLFTEKKSLAIETVKTIKESYRPHRKYKRHAPHKLTDEETRVNSTLLEYGRKHGLIQGLKSDQMEGSSANADSEEIDEAAEERRIQFLMSEMSATDPSEGRLSASTVGSIVGMQSEEIQQIASEYASRQSELAKLENSERVGGVQQHKRLTTALQKQIEQQKGKLGEVQTKHAELQAIYVETQNKLKEMEESVNNLDGELGKLTEMETEENREVLEKLRSLVATNERLKKQEQEFKAKCKEEMARLKSEIEKLQEGTGSEDNEDTERRDLIEKQYQADREKLHKIKLLLARKNREISSLQRKIDEVPTRAELSQYQRRFIELYNQVSNKHKETKQFYTFYNTLDDTKLYLSKEVNLLNSIHDNFQQAMSSLSAKEQFLQQFEQIVEGIKVNKTKVEKKKQEAKMRRDQLNDQYLDLVEKQRLYFKTVKDFTEECRKNEILLTRTTAL